MMSLAEGFDMVPWAISLSKESPTKCKTFVIIVNALVIEDPWGKRQSTTCLGDDPNASKFILVYFHALLHFYNVHM